MVRWAREKDKGGGETKYWISPACSLLVSLLEKLPDCLLLFLLLTSWGAVGSSDRSLGWLLPPCRSRRRWRRWRRSLASVRYSRLSLVPGAVGENSTSSCSQYSISEQTHWLEDWKLQTTNLSFARIAARLASLSSSVGFCCSSLELWVCFALQIFDHQWAPSITSFISFLEIYPESAGEALPSRGGAAAW